MSEQCNHNICAQEYLVLSYYCFSKIEKPEIEVQSHRKFLISLGAKGRIYISQEGINGTISALKEHAETYMRWMKSRSCFKEIEFKEHSHNEHAFAKLTVKVRKELVALGCKVDINKMAPFVTSSEWKKLLEDKDQKKIVIDVRNDYEWKVGHFEGAELIPYDTFKKIQEYTAQLKERVQGTDTKIMMCCTGGIRCEVFSAYLHDQGITNVVQLKGGIISYGKEEKSKHWKGKLFVFDDRMTVPLSDEEAPVIGECHHCKKPCETYYNCANMDCNELFLCCADCLKEHLGACKKECLHAKRVRPFQQCHKPFRRWYNYGKSKTEVCCKKETNVTI